MEQPANQLAPLPDRRDTTKYQRHHSFADIGLENKASKSCNIYSCSPASSTGASLFTLIISVLLYSVISLTIVYFNWWLFTSSFRYRVFISWFQQVIGHISFYFLAILGKTALPALQRFPLCPPSMFTIRKVLPLAFSFIGMVGISNICLNYTQVSTYQVARGLNIFFTIAISYIILGDTQAKSTLFACAIMVFGFIIGSIDSSMGVLAGGASSIFQALYNVTIKSTLQYVENDPVLLLYYNFVISSFILIPGIFISGEAGVFKELIFHPATKGFYGQWSALIFSGLLATLMNLSSYWCVQITSPLTFNIVGFTKSVLQSAGGIMVLGDMVSLQSLTGLFLSLIGSGLYSALKVLDGRKTISYEVLEVADKSELQFSTPVDLPAASENEMQLTRLYTYTYSSGVSEDDLEVGSQSSQPL